MFLIVQYMCISMIDDHGSWEPTSTAETRTFPGCIDVPHARNMALLILLGRRDCVFMSNGLFHTDTGCLGLAYCVKCFPVGCVRENGIVMSVRKRAPLWIYRA